MQVQGVTKYLFSLIDWSMILAARSQKISSVTSQQRQSFLGKNLTKTHFQRGDIHLRKHSCGEDFLSENFTVWYDGMMVWWYDLWDVSLCYFSRTKLFLRPSSIFSLQEAHHATELGFDSLPDQSDQSFCGRLIAPSDGSPSQPVDWVCNSSLKEILQKWVSRILCRVAVSVVFLFCVWYNLYRRKFIWRQVCMLTSLQRQKVAVPASKGKEFWQANMWRGQFREAVHELQSSVSWKIKLVFNAF